MTEKNVVTGTELGEAILTSLRQIKAGKIARVTVVDEGKVTTVAAEARRRMKLSQPEFARLLGISARTLQDWEQGRREPSGAARTLLRIAMMRPEAVLEATV
ncbi:MAG: helix-turn-helix domain-containing protein [Azoarcus sp.]|jgi:putative transcriptional regulator|nr:helix-turn-helix domain-containing protein [Azoarcus sp.]